MKVLITGGGGFLGTRQMITGKPTPAFRLRSQSIGQ